MNSLRLSGSLMLLVAAVGCLALWFFLGNTARVAPPSASAAQTADPARQDTDDVPASDSPFAISQANDGGPADEAGSQSEDPPGIEAVAEGDAAASPTFASTLGLTGWNDEELQHLITRLRDDADLFARILGEFEQATDPVRLRRLANLLGRTGGAGLTETATAMAYSENRTTRHAGLDLLGRVQTDDPAARAVVVDLLSGETDDGLLVDTLNALAIPARGDDSALVPQVLALTGHASGAVRGSTVAILARWADDATLAPVLEQGLLDEDSRVRGASVFAVANGPPVSATMRQNLFAIAENADESREVRSGALLALQSDQLDASHRQRLQEALDSFSTRPSPTANP